VLAIFKKAFTLLNSLSVLENKRLLKIPKELLKKEAELKKELGLINEKISIVDKSDRNQLKKYDSIAFTISLSLDTIQNIYKTEYSGFYNLKYGFKDLSLHEIEQRIPENQAFLNYSLSDSLLSILCITNTGTMLFTKDIDSTFFNEVNILVGLLKKVNTDNSYEEFQQFVKTSRKLYRYLIEPLEAEIDSKDLIIIPDDVLNYISFDALLTQDVNIQRPDYRLLPYLIRKHRTNVANSMQIYYNMKSRKREAENKVYAYAPVYQNPHDTSGLPISYQYIRSLEYTIDEINQLANYLPTNKYSGIQATKDTFLIEASKAKVLHLAMHTIIDDDDPMYSKLLFSYDKAKRNGELNTYELLTLDLNAELAVLSSCSTGDGELQKGEGVMSLSSGFQYAGVPAIVMSLWEVNDRFGSLVIEDFYKNLADGLPKNEALYQAKLKVLSQGNALYAHPFYWAGLTLMGDDSEISFGQNTHLTYIFLTLLFIAILSILYFKYKEK